MAHSHSSPGKPASLKKTTISGSSWLALEVLWGYAARLIGNLIMTRLLLPEAFGLMAIVTMVLIAVVLFSDIGIRQSIVRFDEGANDEFLRVAWTVQILRGLIIALIVVFVGIALLKTSKFWVPANTVYANEQLPYLIMLSSLSVIFESFVSTKKWLAYRNYEYKRITLIGMLNQIVTIACMISFGLMYPTVWALLIGTLLGGLFGTVSSHLLFNGPKMKILWIKDQASKLWNFGRWLVVSSAFTIAEQNAGRLFLAFFFTKTVFGYYVIAFLWMDLGRKLIMRIVTTVGYPILSSTARDTPQLLRQRYRKFQNYVDLLTISLFLAAFFAAPYLVEFLYPDNYQDAKAFVPFISLIILQGRFTLPENLVLVQENTKAIAFGSASNAIAHCILLVGLYALFGTMGALFAASMSKIVKSCYFTYKNRDFYQDQIWIDIAWIVATLSLALIIFSRFELNIA